NKFAMQAGQFDLLLLRLIALAAPPPPPPPFAPPPPPMRSLVFDLLLLTVVVLAAVPLPPPPPMRSLVFDLLLLTVVALAVSGWNCAMATGANARHAAERAIRSFGNTVSSLRVQFPNATLTGVGPHPKVQKIELGHCRRQIRTLASEVGQHQLMC